jgi:parallel beta-helix repeat protein
VKALILFCLFGILAGPLEAATHYVDASLGNDANDGASTSTPWKTLAKVNATTIAPGDAILLRSGGTWREQLTMTSSGSAAAPITIDAYDTGAAPVISGANLVTLPWTSCSQCGPRIWQTAISVATNVVILDGVKGQRRTAISAMAADGDWYEASGELYVFAESNPGTLYSHPGVEFGVRPMGINLTGVAYVTVQNIEISGANAAPYTEGAGIYGVTVHLAGPTASNLLISHVVVVNGGGDGIHLENADHSTVDSSSVAYNEGAGIELYHSNGKFPITKASITNNEVHHNHFNGIFVVGCPTATQCRSVVYPNGLVVTGAQITGNTVHDNGAGIYLHETNNSLVSNNTSYNNTDTTGKGEGYCVGLSGSSSNIVEKNDCYQARLSGIELSIDTGSPPFGSANNQIFYNVVHDDGSHGIFTNYVPSGNNQIAYNLIYNHPNGSCIMANYTGHQIYNNTCYNNREGIHLYISSTTKTTQNISVKNNVIVQSSDHSVLIEPGVAQPLYFRNNDYYPDGPTAFSLNGTATNFAGWRQSSGQDANSIIADPKFAVSSPALPSNFILQPASPLIGKGADLGSVNNQALAPNSSWPDQVNLMAEQNNYWDIGAFHHP